MTMLVFLRLPVERQNCMLPQAARKVEKARGLEQREAALRQAVAQHEAAAEQLAARAARTAEEADAAAAAAETVRREVKVKAFATTVLCLLSW